MHIERREDVATVVLDEPATRNALSFSTFHALGAAIDDLSQQAGLRIIVLRGAGGIFSSGGNLGDLARGLDADYLADYWRRMSATILRLRNLPQVIVSAVDGPAVGAGAALAMAADIVVASSRAKFRWSFGHIGFVPDAGTAVLLSQTLGLARARDLLLTGRWMSAAEAAEAGLITRFASEGSFEQAIEDLMNELRQSSTHSLALTKAMIDNVAIPNLTAAVRSDGIYQLAAVASGDFRDRLSAHAGSAEAKTGTSSKE